MGINFNDKVLVANPTTHFLGRIVFGLGIVSIIIGVITLYTEEFLMVPTGWIAIGIPMGVTGVIMMRSALRKN
jgi:formate/nitrite transporter FocA (FNT family)